MLISTQLVYCFHQLTILWPSGILLGGRSKGCLSVSLVACCLLLIAISLAHTKTLSNLREQLADEAKPYRRSYEHQWVDFIGMWLLFKSVVYELGIVWACGWLFACCANELSRSLDGWMDERASEQRVRKSGKFASESKSLKFQPKHGKSEWKK